MKSSVKRQYELIKFMKSCRYLWPYIYSPEEVDDSPVEIAVEYVLSDGSLDDMRALIKIIGVKKMAEIFRANIDKKMETLFSSDYYKLFNTLFE